MTSDTMNQVVRITWAGHGVFVDEESPGTNPPYIKFSVPEHSFHRNVNGIEMAGDFLAKRIKQTAIESGFPANTKFMYKIRQKDNWTEANKNQAEVAMRACFQTGSMRPFELFRQNHAKEWSAPASEFDRSVFHGRKVYNIYDAINGYANQAQHRNTEPTIIDVPNQAENSK